MSCGLSWLATVAHAANSHAYERCRTVEGRGLRNDLLHRYGACVLHVEFIQAVLAS